MPGRDGRPSRSNSSPAVERGLAVERQSANAAVGEHDGAILVERLAP